MSFHLLRVLTVILLAAVGLGLSANYATVSSIDSKSINVWEFDASSQKYTVFQTFTVDTSGDLTTAYLTEGVVYAGDSNGDLYILQQGEDGLLESVFVLRKAHSNSIQAIQVAESLVITYGNDGVIIQWARNQGRGLTKKETTEVTSELACSLYSEVYSQPVTWSNNNLCKLDCSKIQNAFKDSNSSLSCLCSLGFYWSGQSCIKIFEPNCAYFQNSANTFNSETSSCNCATNYTWVGGECRIDCSVAKDDSLCLIVSDCLSINFSTGTADGTSCFCVGGYQWVGKACWRNCAGVLNSPGTNANTSDCNCFANFYWSNSSCIVNCSAIPGNAGAIDTSTCRCQSGYTWSANSCLKNCSLVPNSNGNNPNVPSQCTCKNSYMWSGNTCVVNCSAVANTAGSVSASACKCGSGFEWAGDACVTKTSSSNLGMILGISVGVGVPVAILVIVGIAVGIYFGVKKRRTQRTQRTPPVPDLRIYAPYTPSTQNRLQLTVPTAVPITSSSSSNIYSMKNIGTMKSMNTMSTLPPPTITNIPAQTSLIRPVGNQNTGQITPQTSALRHTVNRLDTQTSALRPTTSTLLSAQSTVKYLTPQSTVQQKNA